MTYRPPTLIAIVTVLLIWTTIAVGLRVYVRTKVVPSFGKDDGFMVFAWLLYLAVSIVLYVQVYHGFGQSMDMLSAQQIKRLLVIIRVDRCLYVTATVFTKISVGLLLMRLCGLRPIYKAFIYTCMFIICIVGLTLFVALNLQCTPPTPWSHDRCLGSNVVLNISYAVSAANILCDWFFALLPMPLIWQLHLSLRIKISLWSVLGLGILASSARILVLIALVRTASARDKLYAFSTSVIWAQIELGLAIIASSAVTLRPLVRRISSVASRKSTRKSSATSDQSAMEREINEPTRHQVRDII